MKKLFTILFFGALLALLIGVVVLLWPTIEKISTTLENEKMTIAVSHSVTSYMNEDNDHIMHPKKLLVVIGYYTVYVENNDAKGATYIHHDEEADRPSLVKYNETPATGTYTGGVYLIVDPETPDIIKVAELSEGDSIDGLYEAILPTNSYFDGYEYYGRYELCDIWVKK